MPPNYLPISAVRTAASTNDVLLSNIQVYPNSTKDLINIDTDYTITQITVYTILGKEVLNFKENLNTISIKNLSKGVYFMNIETLEGKINIKIR